MTKTFRTAFCILRLHDRKSEDFEYIPKNVIGGKRKFQEVLLK